MLRKVTLPDGRQLRNIDIVANMVEAALVSKTRAAKFIIVIAGTSSGKTITIPSSLWAIRPNIIVTMPTIVLVKETAADICKYVPGFTLGQNVGMQSSGFKIKATKGITFATDGVLLAHLTTLTDEVIMNMYSIIIIDEFHTRSVTIDFAAFVLRAFVARNYTNPACPIVICMSATIDPTRYVAYFGMSMSSVINIPGAPTFKKDLVFLDEPTSNYLATMIRTVTEAHVTAPTTNILVFLPTEATIKKVILGCASLGRTPVAITGAAARDNAIDLTGTNKLFLSTPVAEVGLTINNLSHVIDSGLRLSVEYNPLHDCMIALLKPVTHASAIQRIGRVGRKMSGTAILLYTKDLMPLLNPYTEPNIVYSEFTTTLLIMMAADITKTFWENPVLGVANFWKFYTKKFMLSDIDLIDNPATDSMCTAIAKLYLLGMYSPYTGLTKLGALATGIIGVSVAGIRALFAAYYYKASIFDIATIVSGIEAKISTKGITADDDFIAYAELFDQLLACETVAAYDDHIAQRRVSRSSIDTWIDLRDSILYALVRYGFVLRRHPPLAQIKEQFPGEYTHSISRIRMALYEGYKHNLIYKNVFVRTGKPVVYMGTTRIPADAYIVTPMLTVRVPTPTGTQFAYTYTQACILPAGFEPDMTFCES